MLERRVSFKEKKETELSNLLASREHFRAAKENMLTVSPLLQ